MSFYLLILPGTNTYDRFEMRIHKRVIDLDCTNSVFKNITHMTIPAGMIIEAIEMDEE